ncbi:MAG: leucine-rich repeat domain-containing protein [Draconibacterium sp.]
MKFSIIIIFCCAFIATFTTSTHTATSVNTSKPTLQAEKVTINSSSDKKKKGTGYSVLKSETIVENTIHLTNAGSLKNILSSTELANTTALTITGVIDARDFKTIRDEMNALTVIDLSNVQISAYTGSDGTDTIGIYKNYAQNAIPQFAFWNSESHSIHLLSSIKLPSTLTAIGDCAFLANELQSLIIPSSVTAIGEYAFQECTGLTTLTIPPSVTHIGAYAFSLMQLTTIELPASVTNMEEYVFWGNNELTSVTVAAKDLGIGAFIQCEKLNSVTLTNNVTYIGISAFEDCIGLETISLPNSVSSVGDYLFWGCTSLKTINLSESLESLSDNMFCMCFNLKEINLPASISKINENAFWLSGLQSIHIPSTIQEIGSGAFAYCSDLKTVYLPSSLEGLESAVFYNCTSLDSIILPDNIKYIKGSAFENCSSLSSIELPSSINYIGSKVFYGCTSLKKIVANKDTPIDLTVSDSVFYQVDKEMCTLYVPEGSISDYQIANQWKDFLNIEAIETTGINDELFSKIKVYTSNNSIIIQLPQVFHKVNVTVYDLNGRQISSLKTSNFITPVTINESGIYLVRIENGGQMRTEKVII